MSFLESIYKYVKSGESRSENLGLEIEHFVINERGEQIGFEEVTSLIEKVGKQIGARIACTEGHPVGYTNGEYSITLEPSCQFEISINPYPDICRIDRIYREFCSLWEPIFRERGYRIVTKGNLPLVETGRIDPDEIPLSDKKRYQYMDAYFRSSGKYGKYMMRASASTQVSVDYSSEQDLVKKLRILQKISPILMIAMENKTEENSTLAEAPDRPHLLRIQEWDDLDPERTGFFPYSMDEDFGYNKIAEVAYRLPLILLTHNGSTVYVGNKSAEDLEKENIISRSVLADAESVHLVEHFLSMGFFHFRIKKYIEIRIADSVPINKALGDAALIKGIVYSQRNMEILEKELSETNDLVKIQDAVYGIEKNGLDAVIYRNKTAAEWVSHLVDLASKILPDYERDYLDYVRTTGSVSEQKNTDQ